MGNISKEPSMEEILSSIKRIIAEDGGTAARAPQQALRPRPIDLEPTIDGMDEAKEILELTDEVEALATAAQPCKPVPALPQASLSDNAILSTESEIATRHALSGLSNLVVKPQDGDDNTLSGLIRSMLRPMLKEWLDANLPDLVREIVAKEVARITGREG